MGNLFLQVLEETHQGISVKTQLPEGMCPVLPVFTVILFFALHFIMVSVVSAIPFSPVQRPSTMQTKKQLKSIGRS